MHCMQKTNSPEFRNKSEESGVQTIMKLDPGSKFMKVRCPKCKNEQTVFEKATTNVMCLVCGSALTKANGGKAALNARVLETL